MLAEQGKSGCLEILGKLSKVFSRARNGLRTIGIPKNPTPEELRRMKEARYEAGKQTDDSGKKWI